MRAPPACRFMTKVFQENFQEDLMRRKTRKQEEGRHIEDFGDEVLWMILSKLEIKDLTIMGCVDKRFHDLCNDDRLWRSLCVHYYSQHKDNHSLPVDAPPEGFHWKDALKAFTFRDGPVLFPPQMSFPRGPPFHDTIKIVVLGSGGVGKVCMH